MGDGIATSMIIIKDTRPPESDPASQLISTFLTARSGTYRELAELREAVSIWPDPLCIQPSEGGRD